MTNVAELLIPDIRWDDRRGFEAARPRIEQALALGVGGFVLVGGTDADVRTLTKELRQRSRVPLLIGADLERGAGQQFAGASGLPPLAAIAALDDPNAVARAAKLTAREARTIGVNWAFAPVCDLDLLPGNPATAARAIGADPARVAAVASQWIEACQHEGVLACAKNFPGHGRAPRAVGFSSALGAEAATVDVPRNVLFDTDFAPFRSAVSSRVASVMMAHVRYPTLDASELPATLSTQIMRYLLREKLRFEGLIVSDVLSGWGTRPPEDEAELALRALDAGCDLLLCPADLEGVAASLATAVRDGPLYDDRIEQARRRRLKWAQWAAPPTDYRVASAHDLTWATQLTERVVHVMRGQRPAVGASVELVVIDDAEQDGTPRSITPFIDALNPIAVNRRDAGAPADLFAQDPRVPVLVALLSDLSGTRGRLGYSEAALHAAGTACATATSAGRTAALVHFGPPSLAEPIRDVETIICAWSDDRCMLEAAGRWLARA